jgi:hypothetical protein
MLQKRRMERPLLLPRRSPEGKAPPQVCHAAELTGRSRLPHQPELKTAARPEAAPVAHLPSVAARPAVSEAGRAQAETRTSQGGGPRAQAEVKPAAARLPKGEHAGREGVQAAATSRSGAGCADDEGDWYPGQCP